MPKGKSGGSMSGVVCGEDVAQNITDLVKNQKCQYLVYSLQKIDGKLTWMEVGRGERLSTTPGHTLTTEEDFRENCWEGFVNEYLKETQAVWVVMDMAIKNIDKVIVIQWCPDILKITEKMTYSSSIEAMKNASKGVKKTMVVNEPGEVLFDVFKKDLASKI